MKCAFAAAFTSWSSASVMKSMNMISSTGRRPDCAAPIATPVIAASLIGVSITRPRAELLREPGGRRVRAALGDVLAEHEDALVGAHRRRERVGDGPM